MRPRSSNASALARPFVALLVLALAATFACSFDAAYDGYCRKTPGCAGDALDASSQPAPDGGGDGLDGGSPDADAGAPIEPPRTCTHSSDCRARVEVCNPVGHVCVPTCTTTDDCPSGLGECDLLYGLGVKVCKCSGAQSCASAVPGTTCNPLDDLCEPLCDDDGDCASFAPKRVCDVASRACLFDGMECTKNSDCKNPAFPRCDWSTYRCAGCKFPGDCVWRTDGLNDCNPTTGACVPFNACDSSILAPGAQGGPDTCRYGQTCVIATCALVQNGTCWGARNLEWDWRERGPVIINAAGVSSSDPQPHCPLGTSSFTATIDFYAPNGFTYDNANDQTSVVTMITFQNPTGLGSNGGQRQADFVLEAPESGALSGRIKAGLCGLSAFSGWSVVLWDGHGHSGNVMCIR